ncbi:hypothetical protein [Synechococcus sp. R60.4]|uniref:hypothetical protein n=1 Tax=Synechococcus sp. R60.4 TaxID=2964520 RepID=UPI0039C2E5BB
MPRAPAANVKGSPLRATPLDVAAARGHCWPPTRPTVSPPPAGCHGQPGQRQDTI